jgi:anaerobic selenocysteine-containing dehydrogenase
MREEFRSRRRILALLAGTALLTGLGAAPAAARSSKAAAAYRGSPNGRQRCANCSWFSPPSSCGVVAGPVSGNGWCNLWG